jgi:hypothetical protein
VALFLSCGKERPSELRADCYVTLFYINLHKALVIPLVVALMCWYHNGSSEAFLYLSMHGTYSLLWLFNEATFPDQRFAKQIPPIWAGWSLIFLPLAGYYAAPWLLISRHVVAPPWLMGLVVAIFTCGVFLHYVADAQKFYTLRLQKRANSGWVVSTQPEPELSGRDPDLSRFRFIGSALAAICGAGRVVRFLRAQYEAKGSFPGAPPGICRLSRPFTNVIAWFHQSKSVRDQNCRRRVFRLSERQCTA